MTLHKHAWTTPRSRGQIMARVLTQRERPAAAAAGAPRPAHPSRVFPTSPVKSLREISLWIIATKCFKRMPFDGSRPRRRRCRIPLTQRCRFESDRRGSETQQTESPVAARG